MDLLHKHYDSYKHELSGQLRQNNYLVGWLLGWLVTWLGGLLAGWLVGFLLVPPWSCCACEGVPTDVLQLDFWVPGCVSRSELDRYRNKPTFSEILRPSEEITMMYFSRAIEERYDKFIGLGCVFKSLF